MLVGELILQSSTSIYSDVITRGSGTATFYVDVLQSEGSVAGTLNIDIQHRNPEEDTWATAASFTGTTGTGLMSKTASSLKELIRLKFTLNSGTDAWKRVYILTPVWG